MCCPTLLLEHVISTMRGVLVSHRQSGWHAHFWPNQWQKYGNDLLTILVLQTSQSCFSTICMTSKRWSQWTLKGVNDCLLRPGTGILSGHSNMATVAGVAPRSFSAEVHPLGGSWRWDQTFDKISYMFITQKAILAQTSHDSWEVSWTASQIPCF